MHRSTLDVLIGTDDTSVSLYKPAIGYTFLLLLSAFDAIVCFHSIAVSAFLLLLITFCSFHTLKYYEVLYNLINHATVLKIVIRKLHWSS